MRPRYVTAKDAAVELGLSGPRLVTSWHERGILPAFPFRGSRGQLLFDIEAVLDAERSTRRSDRARRRARELALRIISEGGSPQSGPGVAKR